MQISEFFFDVGRKHWPVTHAKLCPRLRGNCAPPHQHFPLQQHDGNFHLFSRVQYTTHRTEVLNSEEPITKFSRISLKLIWLVYLHLGPLYHSWACGWLLGLMGRSLRHLKLSMPPGNYFLY